MIKNTYIRSIGLGLLSLTILVGCNNAEDKNAKKEIKIDKVASAENFKNVINQLKLKDCVLIKTEEFPAEIDRRKGFAQYTSEYRVLEKLKFIKSTGINKKTGLTKYNITDEGKKHYKIKDTRFRAKGFCIATQEVDEITNFTAPKDFMGVTLSNVQFTLKTKEEPFVKDINRSILKGSMRNRNVFNYEKSASEKLVLTEMKGWMLFSEFNRNK